MKKMSTKIKMLLASTLTFVFLFVGMLDSQAQTAADLGDRKSQEVIESLISSFAFHKQGVTKAEEVAGVSDNEMAALYYKEVLRAFKEDGADLSTVMSSKLQAEGTSEPRFNFLTDAELTELNVQIGKIQTSQAAMIEIDAFHSLLTSSKNN